MGHCGKTTSVGQNQDEADPGTAGGTRGRARGGPRDSVTSGTCGATLSRREGASTHLLQGYRADHRHALRVLPPARRCCTIQPSELSGRQATSDIDRLGYLATNHAALEAGTCEG